MSARRRDDVEALEIDLLVQALYEAYGFDFRQYSRPSLRRRIWRRVDAEGLLTVTGLLERVLHDQKAVQRLISDLSVSVSAMFRDPTFFAVFRKKVVPLLRTYPFIRIWNAGCSTGEEAYSLAMLIQEAGLYDRTRMYATDMNEAAIAQDRAGSFPIGKMRDYTANYIDAGGTHSFSEYYVATGDTALF